MPLRFTLQGFSMHQHLCPMPVGMYLGGPNTAPSAPPKLAHSQCTPLQDPAQPSMQAPGDGNAVTNTDYSKQQAVQRLLTATSSSSSSSRRQDNLSWTSTNFSPAKPKAVFVGNGQLDAFADEQKLCTCHPITVTLPELVKGIDLKSIAETRAGSSPAGDVLDEPDRFGFSLLLVGWLAAGSMTCVYYIVFTATNQPL